MKVTVGGSVQVASCEVHVLAGQSAWIEFDAEQWRVKVNLVFIDDNSGTNEITITPAPDHAVVSFRNWKQGLPGGTTTPLKLGETNGRKLHLMCSGFAVQNLKVMSLSFLLENAREES